MAAGNIGGAAAAALIALACGAGAAHAGARHAAAKPVKRASAPRPVTTEIVSFPAGHATVRLVRGVPRSGGAGAPRVDTQVVSFGPGGADRVAVVRGGPAPPHGAERVANARIEANARSEANGRIEKVSFADPRLPAVTVMRGPEVRAAVAVDLFGPADGNELDRVAFAVDGVESRHGADLRIWRPEPDGPQGPMQVSAAAAIDVGGGDRFDPQQNRLLGRAYLAQMFRRYGNWRDALAAYNWGPGNVDQWIAGGHDSARLPPEVAWYVNRVLRDSLVVTASR